MFLSDVILLFLLYAVSPQPQTFPHSVMQCLTPHIQSESTAVSYWLGVAMQWCGISANLMPQTDIATAVIQLPLYTHIMQQSLPLTSDSSVDFCEEFEVMGPNFVYPFINHIRLWRNCHLVNKYLSGWFVQLDLLNTFFFVDFLDCLQYPLF